MPGGRGHSPARWPSTAAVVLLLDQEPEASIGGQAFWSFGGLFFVNSDEQRLMGVKDTYDLAWQDWRGAAGFDRGVDDPKGQDHWAYQWATGVPAHVDGRMPAITQKAGGRIVNPDRMWHCTEGLRKYDPIRPGHGIRILPGPSSMWFDAEGQLFNTPDMPGYDTLHTLKTITDSGYDYSWFVTTQKIIAKEFALSGSEQNPDLTNKDVWQLLSRIWQTPEPIEKFKNKGEDFVVATTLTDLVAGMNKLTGDNLIELADLKRQIEARDREIDSPYTKDVQVMGIRNALNHTGDTLSRTACVHRILDSSAGPLIAVRLDVLTRKAPRRPADRPLGPGPGRHRDPRARPVRGRGGRRVRRRRSPRLPFPGGHLPRRLPVPRTPGGEGGSGGHRDLIAGRGPGYPAVRSGDTRGEWPSSHGHPGPSPTRWSSSPAG